MFGLGIAISFCYEMEIENEGTGLDWILDSGLWDDTRHWVDTSLWID